MLLIVTVGVEGRIGRRVLTHEVYPVALLHHPCHVVFGDLGRRLRLHKFDGLELVAAINNNG